ncbi:MAG: four-carbon acid sugar kinase family protein [Comamonadaceae bacterium]|nr:MAG: four-carbon acid sugar kinase family protein [Comamonadaceae bacterium]
MSLTEGGPTPAASALKIAWYGDDFTGATDTLATAALAGMRALLFLDLPTPAQLERAGPLDCLGIAGAARAMTPGEMQVELEPVGELFARLGAPVIHYKTCSTFDSAPHTGSIGAAIRILKSHVRNPLVAIIGGQPNLRRYCVFGNLFAGAGAGTEVSRIDRHPTMSRHPVTPMHEADLRLHLSQQGLPQVVSLDYTSYTSEPSALESKLAQLVDAQPDAVLFDIGHADHLAPVGKLVWQHAQQQTILAAGPSSVVQALAAHWKADAGESSSDPGLAFPTTIAPAQGPVLVLAGSLSPMTARQMQAAKSFRQVLLDAAQLTHAEAGNAYSAQMAQDIAALLHAGHHVLACTSSETTAPDASADGRSLAKACGELLAQVLRLRPLKRLGIAGGDTSSHSVQALDAWGLSYQAQLAPGVALCRLHSDDASLDGLEIMLKGGQMGSETLFEDLVSGIA